MSRSPEYIIQNYELVEGNEIIVTFKHKTKKGRMMQLVRLPNGGWQSYRTKWGKYTVPASPGTTEALIALAFPVWNPT